MSRWCHHYACTKDIVDHVLFVLENDEEDEDDDALWEEVLRHFPDSLPTHGVNLLWEDIHRCLTGDVTRNLNFDRGDHPLKLCIHGGEWLRDAPDSVTRVAAEEVPALCRALEAIDRAWLQEKLLDLKRAGVPGFRGRKMDERDIEDFWRGFEELREFYLAAEKLRLPVICTISH
jgi:Domain of unknown function (DUF1877)